MIVGDLREKSGSTETEYLSGPAIVAVRGMFS